MQISNVKAAREMSQKEALLNGADESLIVDHTRRFYSESAPTAAGLFCFRRLVRRRLGKFSVLDAYFPAPHELKACRASTAPTPHTSWGG